MNNVVNVFRSRVTGVVRIFIALVCPLWFGVMVSRADTHYVATNALSISPYTNWANAASNIQWAIDETAIDDTVLVSNGVYQTGGMTNYPSGTVLTNRVAITKRIIMRSANNDPTNTIIKGDWDPATNGPAAVRCVYMVQNVSLIGFMLTNGATLTTGTDDKYGGGVWGYGTSPTLSNCVIAGNSMASEGGGVYNCTLYNCTLSGNSGYRFGGGASRGILYNCALISNRVSQSGYGGGAYGSAFLYNCTLTGNSADYLGGGVNGCTLSNCTLTGNSGSSGGGVDQATLYNCTLIGNSSGHGGGAYRSTLYNCALISNSISVVGYGGGAELTTLSNCTLSGNYSTMCGGGTYNSTLYNCTLIGNYSGVTGGGAEKSTLYNCTLAGNYADYYGGGTYYSTQYNCIVYFNYANVAGSNWNGGVFTNSCTTPAVTGNGNITNDPMLINKGSGYGTNHVAGNYRLAANSPCINTGINQDWMTNSYDLDGRTRIRYGTVDMGAYEAIYNATIYRFH